MDNGTLKKYFNLGDHVEITCTQSSIIGNIVDFSDTVIVIEDSIGNPTIISLDSIKSLKKNNNSNSPSRTKDVVELQEDETKDIQSRIRDNIDKIYEQCVLNRDSIIPTNATVVAITQTGVDVVMDDNTSVTCTKSSMVGYSRENAAIGKRVLCYPSKKNISYASLVEMTYTELYDRFLRAANTKPMPRTTIVGSVLYFLTQTFGSTILTYKKEIKSLVKQLYTKEPEEDYSISSRLKASELTETQKNEILILIESARESIIDLETNEQVKYIDNLISEKLGYKIRRIVIKSFLNNIPIDAKSNDVNTEKRIEESDIFVPATCEIKRYFPKFKNGSATDEKNQDIRFREDIVIGDELRSELNNCWKTPIPVICSYKKTGKFNTAMFIVKPGTITELKSTITLLKNTGQKELAHEIEIFLEQKGYLRDELLIQQIDVSQESHLLLEATRKQRLIKNFIQAEKGFLELISRTYEYDSVVRDLAMMYQEWQDAQKSIAFLEEHLPSLEDKLKTYNILVQLYLSIGNKDKAIFYMEEALHLLPSKNQKDLRKREKLQKRIENVRKKGITSFSSEDIPAPLLRFDANNNSSKVLAFVTNKSIDEKLQFVKERIGQLKNSPELPAYYIAQIQLLQDSGYSGQSSEIKKLLADYCKAKARNFFNESNSIAAREYLLQGISVIEREDLYYLLFLSLCIPPQEILLQYNNTFSGYEVIANKYSIQESDEILYVILRIIAINSTMSRRMMRFLYESETCAWLCDEMGEDTLPPKTFTEKLLSFSKHQELDLKNFEEKINSFLTLTNATEISKLILNLQIPSSNQVNSFDTQNIYMARELANTILDIEKSMGYDECEEICRNPLIKVDNSVASIEKSPSRVSTLCVLPLLLKLKDLLERTLNKKYSETLPNIIIKAVDDARPIDDELELQISILNETGSSRVDNGIIYITSINGNDVANLSLSSKLDVSLTGGATQTCTFNISNQNTALDEIEVDYIFKYQDARKLERKTIGKLTFPINTGDDYEDFENPYIAHVKSNAVKDNSMFKGRGEIIDTICKYVLEDYKGYVLYGQKRSGKSSVLYHITQRLRAEHKAFAVEYTMGNNIVQDAESENDSMANLFYTIISEIGRAIKEVDRNVYKECNCRIIRRHEFQDYPDKTFREYLDFYRDIIVDKLHYEQDKIVLIVDEFTYLYYHILEGKMSPRIMEFWKGLVESRVFSFVFAGQDAMPRFMDDFQNVFASMHPQELTYIDEQSARELIEEPIWNKSKNCSRFHPDAVNEIIKLTACSPFYIMILCSELVKYTRLSKRLPIQVIDINNLVQRMICNESSISRKDFDNLISCGESRLDVIDKDDSIKVLREIALKSRNIEYYDINSINVFNKEKIKEIIDDLLRRGVLERHADLSNKIKIKVGLFKRWLLNHE